MTKKSVYIEPTSRFLLGIVSWTVIHLTARSKSKNPPVCTGGFSLKQVKLTDKPLSFGYSVVDSHSSFRLLQKQKPASFALAGFC
ncbi:hypothetical protein LL061_02320 [Escherichia coli]|uniref:hypothetical protein n=1 Tax=Escherichia coli TaxID=562 RepID=UPI001D18D3FE|nr:hypothetical protein [Escherichia coli]MCC4039140.1 hypothetical protein [Escherichia coli]